MNDPTTSVPVAVSVPANPRSARAVPPVTATDDADPYCWEVIWNLPFGSSPTATWLPFRASFELICCWRTVTSSDGVYVPDGMVMPLELIPFSFISRALLAGEITIAPAGGPVAMTVARVAGVVTFTW